MELTERHKALLEFLLEQSAPVSVKAIALRFQKSVRTIHYDLNQIEYFLKSKGIQLEKKPNSGILISRSLEAQQLKEELGSQVLIYSSSTRVIMILLKLYQAEGFITTEQLGEELQTSKSTVANTLVKLRKELELEQIQLIGIPHYGFQLQGQEDQIRASMATKISLMIEKVDIAGLLQSVFLDEMSQNYLILLLEELLETKFVEEERKLVLLRLMLIAMRQRAGKLVSWNKEKIAIYRPVRVRYRLDLFYNVLSEKFGFNSCEDESAYWIKELINIRPALFDNSQELTLKEYDELLVVIRQMVEKVKETVAIDFQETNNLIKDLVIHLQALLKRHDLKIHSVNLVLDQLLIQYNDIFAVARGASQIFSQYFNVQLSDDELGYIVMYICKAMENSQRNRKSQVLIVCHTGRGTEKLLYTRIMNNIPEIEVQKTMSLWELRKEDTQDIDLVISTSKLDLEETKVIVVSPIITLVELSRIREYLLIRKPFAAIEQQGDVKKSIQQVLMQKTDVTEMSMQLTEMFHSFSKEPALFETETEVNMWEFAAMIFVEVGDMIRELEVVRQQRLSIYQISGIYIHIIMAIPRWKKKIYTLEKEVDLLKIEYAQEIKVIRAAFQKINQKFDLIVKENEVYPIIRYLSE